MTARRTVLQAALIAGGGSMAATSVFAQTGAPWTIPSDDAIHALLSDRIERQRRGKGLVVGIVEPAGQRIITHGRFQDGGPPVAQDTIFQLGSLTKPFTTLLFSDMVLRGEVRLEDPAAMYMPAGTRLPERGRPITLLDLAIHRAGLPSMPDNFDIRARPNPVEAYTPAQMFEFLAAFQLPREPGAAYEYSNLGVSLLGRLLARRAGKPYEALLKERVLAPLSLQDTSISPQPSWRTRLAPGHDRYGQPVDSWEMKTLQASGSLRSSGRDMLALLAAHLRYRQTSLADALDFQVNRARAANPENTSMTLGVRTERGGRQYLHDGGKAGYRTMMAFDPSARTGVFVLANMRSDDGLVPLGMHILTGAALPAADPYPVRPPLPAAVKLPRRLLDSYEGRYQFLPDVVLTVACVGDRLRMQRAAAGIFEFFASGPGEFFSRDDDAKLSFRMNPDGSVQSLVYRDDAGARPPAPRIIEPK
jgi:serine-type D-Ala-D-Ala carboxypeptidase/endopeptidase